MRQKFVIADFGLFLFIEINSAILLNTTSHSNPIALFTANSIGENNPFLFVIPVRCTLSSFPIRLYGTFYRRSVFGTSGRMGQKPLYRKILVDMESKIFCTNIKLCLFDVLAGEFIFSPGNDSNLGSFRTSLKTSFINSTDTSLI